MPMLRVNRFDKGQMKTSQMTPQGYLRAPAFVTRTGVLTYRFADGSVRKELRHPEDVFHPDSMASLSGVPVTNNHPPMLLDAANTKKFMVGYTGDSIEKADEKYLAAPITITDSDAIGQVTAGKTEMSCGYACDLEPMTGTYDGESYTHRQRNIQYNHVALVERGRAGPNVSLHLDSADAVQVEPCKSLEDSMEKVMINGVEYDVSSPVAKAYLAEKQAKMDAATKLEADKKTAETRAADQSSRADRAEARADGLQSELVKVKADLAARNDAADPAKIRAAAKELARIEGVARRVLDKETVAKLDSMDEKAIKVAVIKAENKDANLDGKSDAYIDARFDHIAENLKDDRKTVSALGADAAKNRADGAEDTDAEAAKKRQTERSLNAWKGQEKK